MTDPSLLPAATLLVWAIWSDRIKKRWPFVLAGLVYCLVGFAINISAVGIGAKYFGTFLIAIGGYASFPAVNAWYVVHARFPWRQRAHTYSGSQTTPRVTTSVPSHLQSWSRSVTLEVSSLATCTGFETSRGTSWDVSALGSRVALLSSRADWWLADGLELLFIGIGLILTPIVTLTYWRINKKRELIMREESENGIKYAPEELKRLGDRAPDFRYTL